MTETALPRHIGFIMDGNGRWAKKRGMPRVFGHRQGAAVFKKTVRWCRELDIKAATFYAFSTENWKRPEEEVNGLMNLLRQYIKDFNEMIEEDVRFIFLGDLTMLADDIRGELEGIMERSKEKTGIVAGIALNYGGRAELANAARILAGKCAAGELSAPDITEEMIESELYTKEMPPLDLVIRPSGEKRLSNFLIWQAAYAEFVFMDVLWPDFKKSDLEKALDEYAGRSRRFGGV